MPNLVDTERSPRDVAPTRSCLNDDEVLDFAEGRMSPAQLDAVHAHLDRCTLCQQLVGAAVRDKSASDPSDAREDSDGRTTFGPGDVVAGRYRVQRFIARGGMGEVYDAYDRDLQKRIALKTVISSVCDSQRAVRRLKAEVQLAHRVSHPNVCRIYDLGVHAVEGGGVVHFLTMEFVEGQRLAERLERGPLEVSEAVHVARQLLLGLDAAHGAGILHRDLKSDNVMLRTSSIGPPNPVILDFGLARTIEIDSARVTSGIHGLAGTPCYMAPEQLEAGELSAASDVYAFGVILFEMLTGRLPFSLRAPFERLRKPPPRPSGIVGGVPPSLDKVVIGCLERLPERRFRSAAEALQALDAVDSAPQDSTTRMVRHRRSPRGAAAGAVGLALIGLVAFGRPHSGQPSAAAPYRAQPIPHHEIRAAVANQSAAPPNQAPLATPGSTPALAPEPVPTARTRPARRPIIAATGPPSATAVPEAPAAAVTEATADSAAPLASAAPSVLLTGAAPSASASSAPATATSQGQRTENTKPRPESFGFADPFRKKTR